MISLFDHYAAGEKLYEKTVAPICEAHHLTYMEFTVLMFLANHPQYDTATEVVKYRHLSKSHVSLSIRGLLDRGLLLAAHRGDNHRTIHLTLTETAAPIILDGRAAQKAFRNTLFSGFSDSEVDMLTQLLSRMDDNIKAHSTGCGD